MSTILIIIILLLIIGAIPTGGYGQGFAVHGGLGLLLLILIILLVLGRI